MRLFRDNLGLTGTRQWRTLTAVAAAALVLGWRIASGAEVLTEPQVKAAYIYNFAKFVQWPMDAFVASHAPLVLCVAAKDGLGGALTPIDGKPVQGRELQVKRAVKADDLNACHILFVPENEARATSELLRKASALPLLTIGEREGFAAAGGCIGFVTGEERVQFEINPDAISRANLKVSSQLLRLATIVRDARGSLP